MSRDPVTTADWQEAVNGAEAMLLVDAARQYGLVTGGPKVNAERCRDILARGEGLGYRPEKNAVDAVIRALAE